VTTKVASETTVCTQCLHSRSNGDRIVIVHSAQVVLATAIIKQDSLYVLFVCSYLVKNTIRYYSRLHPLLHGRYVKLSVIVSIEEKPIIHVSNVST
jgi:hypothetical protein